MAAIGSIRKHGILLMFIIGVALLAFVMGDVTKLTNFYSDKNIMVKINGKKLDEEYRARLEQNTALWKIYYNKQALDETETFGIHDWTWDQLLEQTILEQQLEDLGLQFTKEMKEEIAEEMVASLNTQQPNQLLNFLVNFLAQRAPIEEAINFIANIEDYKNKKEAQEIYSAYKAIENIALLEKQKVRYMALAKNLIVFSDESARFFAENNNSLLAKVVTIMPSAAQFNEIQATVTDKEITDWFKKNKERYLEKNDSRDIDVAFFPIKPTPEDLAAIKDTATNRAARLKNALSIEEYNISMMLGMVDSIYYKREDISSDTLAKLVFDRPVGSFIEPFEENAFWLYGKTYGAAKRSDSVLVAFLVVDYKTDGNPNSMRTKEEAKFVTDSISNLLSAGANIFTLLPDYLGGRSATDTTIWVAEHSVHRQFYDSLLHKNLYTQEFSSAYFVYQVLERTLPVEKRLYVIYKEEIKHSDATEQAIKNEARQLQAESISAEELMTHAAQKGIQVVQGKNITSMMSSISTLQNVREIINWAFNPNISVDAVSDVFTSNKNFFAVAAVRDTKKKGIPKLEKVKETIEAELTVLKKLELVQNKLSEEINSGSSIEQIAEKYQVAFKDSITLTFGRENYQHTEIESVALGKIFTLPIGQPTVVAGKTSVYAVSVYNYSEPPEHSPNFALEKSILVNAVVGRNNNEYIILEGLKDKANTLDHRYLHFSR
ncbi:MAG: SurA N-terminal domain-containing protein [Bacteroidales bacterium]|jgi:peptidyl-prolyl cis-trans isomerase D|nr:SurA N-terminal domain-containing protein [Bacteroidales bacterium]